jgi:predicted ATPase
MKRIESVVITGGSSCGKSSVVGRLANLGYPTLQEVARRVLSERKSLPTSIEEHQWRQKCIAKRQYAAEEQLLCQPHTEPYAFFDRGLADNPAYCRHLLGFVPSEIQDLVSKRQYDYVFILEQLPFKQDGIRLERDEKEAKHIHDLIHQSYLELGYSPIVAPIMPAATSEEGVDKRIDFIFAQIQKIKGGVV